MFKVSSYDENNHITNAGKIFLEINEEKLRIMRR